jgi:hypothetical protein
MRGIGKSITLAGASTCIALLLGEAIARCFASTPPAIVDLPWDEGAEARRAAENRDGFVYQGWGDSSRHLFVDTPTGRRLRANAAVRIRHFLNGRTIDFRTNSLGYRNREIGPKRIYRVLFLGDSITGGDYLQEPETFVRQVEAASWRTETPIETINAGMGAISLMNELAILEETGLSTEPDAVVLGFYLNDFNESYGFQVGRLPRWLNGSYLAWLVVRSFQILSVEFERRDSFAGGSLMRLQAEIDVRYAPRPGDPLVNRTAFFMAVRNAIEDWGSGWSEELWQDMEPLFVRFRQLADIHDFEPLIVIFPVALQVRAHFVEDYPQRRMKEIGYKLGIPVLDFLPGLRAFPDRGALFYDHCHFTPSGNQRVADEIYRFLRRHLDLPAARFPADLAAGG